MKALTLTQPWATLVAIGAKRVETRGWSTSYRGPLAIHAAKGFPTWAREFFDQPPFFSLVLRQAGYKSWKDLPRGVVLCTTELIAVLPTVYTVAQALARPRPFELTDQERAFGNYLPGRYAFYLGPVTRLATPVPARGALSLWDWDGAA